MVVFRHAVGVQAVTGLAIPLFAETGPHVHAGGVVPDEKWLFPGVGIFHKINRRLGELLIDGFHALSAQGTGVFDQAIGLGTDYPPGSIALPEFRVLGVEVSLGLLLGIHVVQVAEKFIEAVGGGQVLILVAQVILAKLPGGIAHGLDQLGDGRVLVADADGGTGHSHLQQSRPERMLTGDKRRAGGGAALFAVGIGE